MNKPTNTIFLLQSLDWKINPWNSWDTDKLSQWREFAKIKWLQEWIKQYYDLELKTDLHSLNTWFVMKKIWVNKPNFKLNIYEKVSFIIIDSKHLDLNWVENLANSLKKLYIVTTNQKHPAFDLQKTYENIVIICYEGKIDFTNLMEKLKNTYSINEITKKYLLN